MLAHHWLAAADEDRAIAYLTAGRRQGSQDYALDEAIGHYRALLPLLERRGDAAGDRARPVQARARPAHLAAVRRGERDLPAGLRALDAAGAFAAPADAFRTASTALPKLVDPARAIAWTDIQLCMQLFDRLVEAWPERTIVPSLAERWEISDDGLHYVFRLRGELTWSDGTPLTAHDVEYGIKTRARPERSGRVGGDLLRARGGAGLLPRRHDDPDRIGVRALDDLTVEFRLAAPAPYFMSVMNRPDGGPMPRHAIELDGDVGRRPSARS